MSDIKNGLLISDFNIENLASYLRSATGGPEVACEVAPYGQLIQTLLDPTAFVLHIIGGFRHRMEPGRNRSLPA